MNTPCVALTLPGRPGCRLDLRSGSRSATFHGSDICDSVREIVLAAVDLARGRRVTTFVWWSEPGGVFVDIALGPRAATLIVHEMNDPDWGSPHWYPERGPAVFRLNELPRRFVTDFFAAVISLPEQAAATNRPVWGHPLPENLIDELRRFTELGFHNELNNGGELP